MKYIIMILTLLQTLLLAQDSSLQKVKLQLQWKYQFQFAGFIMAKEMGYYKDVGLDVELIEYNNSNIVDDLESGKVDYALTNSIISYKDKKLRDVSLVATYFQRSPLIFITQPEIKSALDLKNRNIMISEDNRINSSLGILLEYFNINDKNTNFLKPTFNLDDFITKKVDVITGFRSNELFILDNKKIPYNIIDPVEYGFSTNAINLFVTRSKAKTDSKEINNFLEATKRGWEYALKNIETTARLIHKEYQLNKSLAHLVYEAEVTKELMLLNLYDIGEVNREFVLKTYNQLIKSNTIDANQSSDNLTLTSNSNCLISKTFNMLAKRVGYSLIIAISIFLVIVILIMLFWSLKLKKEIKKRSILQEAYKAERDLNEHYLDTADVLIVAFDTQGRVTMLNKRGEELLGYSEEELLGKVWFEIGVLPDDIAIGVKEFFDNIINVKIFDDTSVKHPLIDKNGEQLMFSFKSSLLYDGDGRVNGVLSSASDITKLIEIQEILKHQAHHDKLTTLPNRVLLMDRISQAIKNAKRFSENIAIIFIDLDHFKDINDTLGHDAGDDLLKLVSKILKQNVRNSDTVSRFGGDEFIILLDHFEYSSSIVTVIDNIINALKEALIINNQEFFITLSLGISIYPQDGLNSETLIKNADTAMYEAKKSGRNNYKFYTNSMSSELNERILLEKELRKSLQRSEMRVYYQLQMNSKTQKIVGMEALVRWIHPEMGLITPDRFIPLAEGIGFITELDEWVMNEAASQFKRWSAVGYETGVLSLNLSVQRLEKDEFIDSIKSEIKSLDIKHNCISFEVTESQIMNNPKNSIEKLHELSKLGIRISIDDFGTGYSSLSYLKKLPINKLKIDKSFIQDIPSDKDDVEITKTIIAMAKNLNLEVIAEGVETKEQVDFLELNGCSEIQGYYYHKPAPADKIEEILKKNE